MHKRVPVTLRQASTMPLYLGALRSSVCIMVFAVSKGYTMDQNTVPARSIDPPLCYPRAYVS